MVDKLTQCTDLVKIIELNISNSIGFQGRKCKLVVPSSQYALILCSVDMSIDQDDLEQYEENPEEDDAFDEV